MKNLNFLLGLGLFAASLGAQAQTTIASVGFEAGDSKYTTTTAYTPGGTYGNWVNRQEADAWNEQYSADKHSGEYCMQLVNDDSYTGNTWDRGFMIGNLHLKDNTSYRVSFWVKAETNFINTDGAESATKLKSSLSIGHEYCDMPISTKSGLQYYNNYTSGIMTGDWRHISYVTYFTNKADQDALSMNYTGKEDANGQILIPQGDPFPEEYFLIINAYNPGEYLLDDIKVEEGVTFNEVTYNETAVRLDFGYPTNIAELAKANYGSFSLDPSCVSVTINGAAVTPEYVEGKEDGYLYIFFADAIAPSENDKVVVSFTPADNCPILYNDDKRPSADTESELKVGGFTAETGYYDESIDVLPASWSEAVLVSTEPENNSFELASSDVTSVTFTYNKEMGIESASAILSYSDNFGTHEQDLSDIKLSDDKQSVIVALPSLKDGEYTVTLSGAENSFGVSCTENASTTFSIGVDEDESESETVYASDFDNEMTGGIPCGWLTENEAGIHEYGFNDEARTSQYNYNWGGQPGGGGARLYEGFSGDFSKAMYWGTRGTELGYASYGELIKDYIDENGVVADDCPEGIGLYLDARKYQISFLMAAWKGEPTFTFTLEDLSGNVYAQFSDILAAPNVNGVTGKVTGSVKCQTDFTVDQDGYYVLKFTSNPAVWQEFLLANVKLITMPSKAAYYKQLLKKAIETAEPVLETAAGDEYNGDTKSALIAAISTAKTQQFHTGSAVEALIDQLTTLSEALQTRVDNIDNFSIALLEATEAYEGLEGKYKNNDLAEETRLMLASYANTDPSTLSDAELNEVTPKLVNISTQLQNITNTVDILTFDAVKAGTTAQALGADALNVFDIGTDDREVIAQVNANIKGALVSKIAAGEDLTPYQTKIYDPTTSVEEIPAGEEDNYDEDGHPVLFRGIDLTGYIQNTHLYRVNGNDGVPGWNIDAPADSVSVSISFSASASDSEPVIDAQIQSWGANEYDMNQTISNLPAGHYTLVMQTRTPKKAAAWDAETEVYYNGQDANGTWDKFIYAQGDKNEAAICEPYAGASGLTNTLIKDITVENGTMTIGAREHYVSGLAQDADATTLEDSYKEFWTGTSYLDYINLYFISPLEGYDYAAEATGINTLVQSSSKSVKSVYSVTGAKTNALQRGINIVKYADGSVRKVIIK